MNIYLNHTGIKGMKWGVRRIRPNSSPSQGKKKTSGVKSMSDEDLTTSVRRLNLENTYRTLSKKPTKMERTKKLVDASSGMVNQVQKLHKDSLNGKRVKEKLDLSKMTDQELREKINRTNLERQYNDMFATEKTTISKGQRYTSNILDVAGSALAIGGSALGIALAIKELKS